MELAFVALMSRVCEADEDRRLRASLNGISSFDECLGSCESLVRMFIF